MKNILVTGGLGQVAIGLVEILTTHPAHNKLIDEHRKLFLLDVIENPDSEKYKFLNNENITYVYGDYVTDISDLIIEHDIDLVVHLVPDSCLPIWNAIKEVPWPVRYIDASVYCINYHPTFEYPNHTLLSNFIYFDKIREEYGNSVVGISSTGMNPGIVNYLFEKYIRMYGEEGLIGAYVIENDTYTLKDKTKWNDSNKLYVTWGGDACPAECSENPVWFRDGVPITLNNTRSCDINFKFKMGGKEHKGMAVIHEECYSLSKKYDVETTFLYSLPESVVDKIKRYNTGENNQLTHTNVEVMSPLNHEMEGNDTLGIKLVYKDKEINVINTMGTKKYVSGTTYQVSCGVMIALRFMLEYEHEIPRKVNWVDEVIDDEDRFFNRYGEILESLLDFKVEVLGESDGLLKNRANRKIKENILCDSEDDEEETYMYSFNDMYWYTIEEELRSEYGKNEKVTNSALNEVFLYMYNTYKSRMIEAEDDEQAYNFFVKEAKNKLVNDILKRSDLNDSNICKESFGEIHYLLLTEGINSCDISRFLAECSYLPRLKSGYTPEVIYILYYDYIGMECLNDGKNVDSYKVVSAYLEK